MAKSGEFSKVSRLILVMAALVIIIAGIREAQSLVVTFLLSGFFAVLCGGPFMYLLRKGLPPFAALILIGLVIGILQLILVSIIGTAVTSFHNDLPVYQERLQGISGEMRLWLEGVGVPIPEDTFRRYLDPAVLFKASAGAIAGVGNVISNAFMIFLTLIFMLFEGIGLQGKLEKAFGKDQKAVNFDLFIHNVQRYMMIKAAFSLVTGLLIYALLLVLGVDYALLWGLVAFLLNFVPTIGSILAAIPAVLLAMVQLGPMVALFAGIGFLVVNILVGNLIEPRFMGRGLGLSTLVVFLSLVFWGWVMGPVGMLLSVPLTMTVKIAVEIYPDTRWIGVMLGPAPETVAANEDSPQ